MNALIPLLLLAPAADPPAPKLPVGKDTTHVLGPLDRNGYIDYEAALNAELGRGVTRDTNANVLLWAVIGPTPEGGDGMPPDYFKWLDAPAPPRVGAYFVGQYAFMNGRLGLTRAQLDAVYEFQGKASRRPWVQKDCPPLAEWLTANERQLAPAAEATKRPHYFNPLVSRKDANGNGSLIGALLPGVQKCRELAACWSTRAMLRLGEKKYDAAWADIAACHRLGRLVGRGATLIEMLVGAAIHQTACNATLAYLEAAPLTADQLRARLKELRDLPPLSPASDKIGLGERLMGLDALQMLHRGDGSLLTLLEGDAPPLTREAKKVLERMDWAPAMRAMNRWYDRMADAMRTQDRAAREKAFDRLDEELRARKQPRGPLDVIRMLAVPGAAVGDILAGMLMPATRRVQGAHDRTVQVEWNLQLAFALAAYRADTGRYPAKLDDLAPHYLPAIPDDLYAGKPLTYKPAETGYLFYSVGPNGKDEGGSGADDNPAGDDLGVRVPLTK